MAVPNGGRDLEILQMKANQITDESLESTRRMVAMCEESQGAGARTLEMLHHQGEQLDRVGKEMEVINNEMKQAEKHIIGMEKWCGLCLCPWNRSRDTVDSGASAEGALKPDEKIVVDRQPVIHGRQQAEAKSRGPFINRINNDAREDEMEENLQAVGSVLGNLKNMAKDMGQEIDKHNSQLDRITSKTEAVDTRVQNANQRTEKLLK